MRLALPAIMAAILFTSAAAAAPPAVRNAWIRAMPPGAASSAGYLEIVNDGPADRLLGATTNAAERVEIHARVDADGVVRMQRLEALAVPADGQVTLAPGGAHLMLMGLAGPLKPGDSVAVTLRFEQAGAVEVVVPVRDTRAGR